MTRSTRGARRVAAAIAGALILAPMVIGPAAAADESPTAPTDSGAYPPALQLTTLSPICNGDVPYLQYSAELTASDAPSENTDAAGAGGTGRVSMSVPTHLSAALAAADSGDDVTIRWINPTGGADVVQQGTLNGTLLWPGAVVDSAGKPLDWPGWSQKADGTWVEGDEFDWVRPSVQVEFTVGDQVITKTVAYPPSSPDCATTPPGETEPTIKVKTKTPVCVDGVSYLDYAVEVTGTSNDTVTLTWHNPEGDDFVQADQPLEGKVLWPGAYPDRSAKLSAPQWKLVNNMWQDVQNFGWATGTVDVTFAVNPETTVAVTYPQDTSNCYPGSETPGAPGEPGDTTNVSNDVPGSTPDNGSFLPQTGAEIATYVGGAVLLLLVGSGLVVWTRRHRKHTES